MDNVLNYPMHAGEGRETLNRPRGNHAALSEICWKHNLPSSLHSVCHTSQSLPRVDRVMVTTRLFTLQLRMGPSHY